MNKNTTISDLNVEIDRKGNSFKKHLVAKISIAVIEFLLSSAFYCYGIILSEFVLIGSHKYGEGIWTSILFICSWSFTDSIAIFISEYFEDRKNVFFRYVVGCSTAILFLGMMIPNSLTLYMVFGGVLSNLISTQIRYFATEKLDMDLKIFEAHRQVARAVSLFIMPHCVFALVSNYEINQVKLIFASILLHIIPAGLLVKTDENWSGKVPSEMSRYQTIGRFANQLSEMKNFSQEDDNQSETESSSSDETPVFEINPQYLPTQNETGGQTINQNQEPMYGQNSNSGVQNLGLSNENTPNTNDLKIPVSFLNLAYKPYYYNGVSILPVISEENEEESEDINFIDPKRLSRISDKLEILKVQDQIRKDSIREIFNISEVTNEHRPDPINKIEYIANFKEDKNRISVLNELKSFNKARHCFHCSPYRKYIWTRRLKMFKDFLNDNFLRPLYHSLKNLYFYPSLMTKVITNLVSTLYITLAPFMAMQKSWKQNLIFSTENATFLLTYIAFAWCFFLVTLPLVLKLSHAKIRLVFGLGLVISGTSLWHAYARITDGLLCDWWDKVSESYIRKLTFRFLPLGAQKCSLLYALHFLKFLFATLYLLLSGKLTNDVITLSSLLFGFGYGIITYTEKIVFRSSIGMRPWYFVRGPLEVLSAIFIIIIYYLIYLHRLDLTTLLLVAALSYYFNAILWFCLPFIKYFSSIIVQKVVFDERSQQEGFFH